MQELKFFQSLWAMQDQELPGYDGSPEQAFEIIAKAGFKGVCLDLHAHQIDEFLTYKPHIEANGLECIVNIFPKDNAGLRALLAFAKEMNAIFANIIGFTTPLSPAGAIPIIRRWLEIAEEMEIDVLFETHRECITNDMFATLEIIDNIPEMRLCGDLSHYVVNREVRLPISKDLDRMFQRLIERSDCLQGRVAGREQVQVQIGFPQHQEWVEVFKDFWRRNIVDWKARSADDAFLIYVCELGPPPYAMTDANGKELSNRWEEALQLREWVTQIWDDVA